MICYSSNSRMGRRGNDVAEGDCCVGAWLRRVVGLHVAGIDWSCHDCCSVKSIESQMERGEEGRGGYISRIALGYMWSDAAQVDVWGDLWTKKSG